MNDLWVIKDADGNITNPVINADEEFVAANFDYYEKFVAVHNITAEGTAIVWRDEELKATDLAAQTPDWPNRDNIVTYRAALRNWPSTADFPDTKPTLGS